MPSTLIYHDSLKQYYFRLLKFLLDKVWSHLVWISEPVLNISLENRSYLPYVKLLSEEKMITYFFETPSRTLFLRHGLHRQMPSEWRIPNDITSSKLYLKRVVVKTNQHEARTSIIITFLLFIFEYETKQTLCKCIERSNKK